MKVTGTRLRQARVAAERVGLAEVTAKGAPKPAKPASSEAVTKFR
jgi:hypothetical protein